MRTAASTAARVASGTIRKGTPQGDLLDRHAGRGDLPGIDAKGRRNRIEGGDHPAERRAELRHPGERQAIVAPVQLDAHRPDAQAEHDFGPARGHLSRVREREGGANRRMARHRQLLPRREDADPHVGPRLLGREDERAFREVHLKGDRLHQLCGQASRLEKHSELIAAEEVVGEDVEVQIAIHDRQSLVLGP